MPKSKKPVAPKESSSESEEFSESELDTETEVDTEPEPVVELKKSVKSSKDKKEKDKDTVDKPKKSKEWVDLDDDLPKKQTVVLSAEPTKQKDTTKPSSFDYAKYRDLDLSIDDLVKYAIVKSYDSKQFHLGKIFKQILRGMHFEDVLPEVKSSASTRGSYEGRGRGNYRGNYRGQNDYSIGGRGGASAGDSYRGRIRGTPRTFQYDE
jgi:hypothetical protein